MVSIARVSGRPHGRDEEDAAIRILRGIWNMNGISGQLGVGNLDIAAGLEMLEGLSVDSAQLQSERHPRALAKRGRS